MLQQAGFQMDTHLTKNEDWDAWRACCALDRCAEETRLRLRTFAQCRFTKYRSLLVRESSGAAVFSADDMAAWHLMEVYMQISEDRRGKSYKEWLFTQTGAEGQEPVESLEAGASILLRDVAREYVRRECLPAFIKPLDEKSLWTEPAYAEDPGWALVAKEWHDMAVQRAENIFPHISHSARIALIARHTGLSLAHPSVEKAAAAKKSSLAIQVKRTWEDIALQIQADFPEDTPSDWITFTRRVMTEINNLIFLWISAEKKFAQFCMLIEQHKMTFESVIHSP